MKVGIIGLGRMGESIAHRLYQAGHEVFGYDIDKQACKDADVLGINCVTSLEELASKARVFWMMVPHGDSVDKTLDELTPHLKGGDIIVDGGNSYYKNTIKRAEWLAKNDIILLDCGTSGGLYGRQKGFSLMVGGDYDTYIKIQDVFHAIAWPGGVGLMGPSGMGHYVKMIHNGIEYALLQAYADGFNLIKHGYFKDKAPDLEEISRVWSNGSVIRSYILDLAHTIFAEDQQFDDVSGEIGGGSTGRWTVEEAKAVDIKVPLIKEALKIREWSQKTGGDYATKIVALLRKEFGGHPVKKV